MAAVLSVIILAVAGYFVYSKYHGGEPQFTKTFDAVTNEERLPSPRIRFLILGSAPVILTGNQEEKDGKVFQKVSYTTATSMRNLFDEYEEFLANTGWTIQSSNDSGPVWDITAKNSRQQITLSLREKDGQTLGIVSLLATKPTTTPTTE